MALHDKLDALRIDRLEKMFEVQQAQMDRVLKFVGGGRASVAGGHDGR